MHTTHMSLTERMPVLVIGGTGVTGAMVCDILRRHSLDVHYTSRTGGPQENHHALDLSGTESHSAAVPLLRQFEWVVMCAGPFEELQDSAHWACLEAGTNIVDVNDNKELAEHLEGLGPLAVRNHVRVLTGWGLSPGLTTAVIGEGRRQWHHPLEATDITTTLRIGADQASGAAAICSMFHTLHSPHTVVRVGKVVPESRRIAEDGAMIAYETPDVHYLAHGPGAIRRYDYFVRFDALSAADIAMMQRRKVFASPFWRPRLARFCARLATKKAQKRTDTAQTSGTVMETIFTTEGAQWCARLRGRGSYALTASCAAATVCEALGAEIPVGVRNAVSDPAFTARVLERVLAEPEVISFTIEQGEG